MRSLVRQLDFTAPDDSPNPEPRKIPRLVKRYRYFLIFVAVPTLIVMTYLFGFAADQYESESHFYVVGGSSGSSGGSSSSSSGNSAGSLLNGGGATSKAEEETLAALDFLGSHDAVSELEKQVDVPTIYRRPEADLLSRLTKDATAEETYRYLFKLAPKIDIYLDFMSGVGVLRVRAFRPEDAQAVSEAMLQSAEKLMDQLSVRLRDQILRLAKQEVATAEARVSAIAAKVTEFRVKQSSMDPEKSSDTVLGVISNLEGSLAQARSDLKAAQAYLKPDSSSYAALTNHVAALESEISAQERRLTGSDGSMAPTVAAYDQLLLDRQFAEQDYTSALSALESARIYAERQQFFVERVVTPNKAEESEYPRRVMLSFTVFLAFFFTYVIVGLIVAGIRDHVA